MIDKQTEKSILKPAPARDENKFLVNLKLLFSSGGNPYVPGIVLFIFALIIGLLTYKDYGISWDEPVQRELGKVTYNYIFNGDSHLKNYEFRGLGTGFELPLIFMEKWLHIEDSRSIFEARHRATHIFFLLSAFCGYILAYRLFKNKAIASLAFILLAFHPRIYAHSYFNTKDIPFLSAFLIALLLGQVAFEKNKSVWFLLLGLACGYATSIRALGIILVPCISIFFVLDIFRSYFIKEKLSPVLRHFSFFILGFCALLYVAWPILWSNPFFYFTESFHKLANIEWGGRVLFNGKIYKGNALPWNYMPVWFSITVPELWLLSGLAGLAWIVSSFVKNPMKFLANTRERNYLLYLVCFAGPVIAMVVFNGANIDDWRHLYFIYPSFVMMVLFAINKLATGRRKMAITILCLLQISFTGFFMVSAHPFQQVYFNNFISHSDEYLRKNYDLEYWGCTYKQGLDHLIAVEPSPTIKLYCEDKVLLDNNILLLPEDQRARIQFTDFAGANYLITNFRGHPYDYPSYDAEYSVTVLNNTILSLFRLEKDSAVQKKWNEEELSILYKALSTYPDDGNIQARIGSAYFRNAQYDSAEVHDELALRLDPSNTNAMIDLAGVYFVREKYPQVFELLKRAIALQPDFIVPYANLGRSYLRLGNYDSAICYLGKTVALDPENTEVIMQLGVAYSQAQKYDLAEACFNKAIGLNPNNISAMYNLGLVYIKSAKFSAALELFKKTVAINPGYAHGYSGMAQCYFGMKQYETAIETINKALAIDPADVKDIPTLALSYKAVGKMDMARKYEVIAQKNNPEFKL